MIRKSTVQFCLILLPSLAIAVSCLSGCSSTSVGNPAQNSPIRIQLSGSSTLGPLAREIGDRYETKNPRVRVEVQTGGSSAGIADAKSGLADIGMSSRPLKDSELEGRRSWTVAMDGVCFIVNADNPVNELTKLQIKSLLQGDVDNWAMLGGNDESIVLINRAAGRSELDLVSAYFGVKQNQLAADLVVGENQQGIKTVANNKNSISYMSVGASEDAIVRGANIKMLPLNGIPANIENVESNAFPLSRPLIFVTKSDPSDAVEAFIEFAQSSDVHDLVRQLSYVPIAN